MRHLISICFTVLSVGTAYGGNLLVNPGFESGLSAWTTTVGSATYTADATVAKSGLLSAKGIETDRGSLGALFQDVTGLLIPGKSYTISGWIRTQDVVGGGGAAFGLSYVNAVGATPADGNILGIGLVKGTQDWQFFGSAPFVLPAMPLDTVALHFSLDFSDAAGTAWFDDMAVTLVPEPPAGVLAIIGSLPIAVVVLGRRRRRRTDSFLASQGTAMKHTAI